MGGCTLSLCKAAVKHLNKKHFHQITQEGVINFSTTDIPKQQLELLKCKFLCLFDAIKQFCLNVYMFSRTHACGNGLVQQTAELTCASHVLAFIDNYNAFWAKIHLFDVD